ncbi:hypothetical protein CMI37_31090 [Candidatus Pacearchaeota archaeon]|nr:hypothetical protein [Candidatus Pacearchaeota archaeon]|tara:strand:+ start:3217 stop:3597 length:381 start_codon:yes stop_codon:yes gene_type:complete
MKHICKECKVEFDFPKKERKYCSRKCLFVTVKPPIHKGENHPNWKGGKTLRGKYYFIHSPTHPFHNARNEVREHRLIMETKLGRYLSPEEVVHHLDLNSLNNDVSNLHLFKNQKEHAKYHGGVLGQ